MISNRFTRAWLEARVVDGNGCVVKFKNNIECDHTPILINKIR